MKKVLTNLAVLTMFTTMTYPAMAENVMPKDIADDAKQAIEVVISKEVMGVDTEGNFLPDKIMTRAEFLHSILKILDVKDEITAQNTFTDVKEGDEFFNDILLSKQLGLIYGYEDGTFLPNAPITHSEATSIISHITKDKFIDCSTLVPYTDKNDIPDWAKLSYSKSLDYGITIKEDTAFAPNKGLSRKESAVVFADLIAKLAPKPEPEAVPVKENILSCEHIAYEKASLDGVVNITNLKKVILRDNIFMAVCDNLFGSRVKFVLPEGLKTNEGTVLFENGTELTATMTNAKPVALEFDTLKAGDKEYQIRAKLLKTNLRKLKPNKRYALVLLDDINIEK